MNPAALGSVGAAVPAVVEGTSASALGSVRSSPSAVAERQTGIVEQLRGALPRHRRTWPKGSGARGKRPHHRRPDLGPVVRGAVRLLAESPRRSSGRRPDDHHEALHLGSLTSSADSPSRNRMPGESSTSSGPSRMVIDLHGCKLVELIFCLE